MLFPDLALRLRTADAVHCFHFRGARPCNEQVALLFAGRFHLVPDLQHAVALKLSCLHPHLQRPPSTDDVPFPLRTVLRLKRLREGADADKLRMPPPDLQKIGFRNGLFPVAHPYIVTMRELQIARRRVAQLQESGGDVELQRVSPFPSASPGYRAVTPRRAASMRFSFRRPATRSNPREVRRAAA